MTSKRMAFTTIPMAIALLAAAPTAAERQAFLDRPAMYLQVELTHTGTRTAGDGTAKDALHDAAWRFHKTAKFEVPLMMAMPGTPPPSSMQGMSVTEMGEEGRFAGWMASPPDDPAAEEALAAGKPVDISKSGLFLPVAYTIDDVHQSLYRDMPTDGFATDTRTSKGRGTAYAPLSGMLTCDLKKMICDINNVPGGYNGFKDQVAITTTSNVPGFVTKNESMDPALLIPAIPAEVAKQLVAMPIAFPEPIQKTFTAPYIGSNGRSDGSTVTVKLTLSQKPIPKVPPAK